MKRRVKVCALQLESEDGRKVAVNLEKASRWVELAAAEGSRLILLPELFPTGYNMKPEFWDNAEPRFNSETVEWLCLQSKKFNVWLGTSFLEVDGDDFFNTFIMTSPSGKVAGRVRKQIPQSYESFFYAGENGPRCFWTDEFGFIAVILGYENLLAPIFRRMIAKHGVPDLILLPISCPSPPKGQPFFSELARQQFLDLLKAKPIQLASLFGVPVVYANKVGPWAGLRSPFPFELGPPCLPSEFPGYSAIVDSNGVVVDQVVEDTERMVIGTITLDPELKVPTQEAWNRCSNYYWIDSIPSIVRWMPIVEFAGKISYRFSRRRVEKAREKLRRWLPPSGIGWFAKGIIIGGIALVSYILLKRTVVKQDATIWVKV